MRKLKFVRFKGPKNSLAHWTSAKNPLRILFNFLIVYSAKYFPSLALKRLAYRLIGVKIGKEVSFGLGSVVDIFYPELIEVGDNSIIGYNTTILGHEFLIKELRIGKVRIGKDVMIGANCTILPGITIGNGAVVSAMSLVNKDVKPGEIVGGIPAKRLRRRRK